MLSQSLRPRVLEVRWQFHQDTILGLLKPERLNTIKEVFQKAYDSL